MQKENNKGHIMLNFKPNKIFMTGKSGRWNHEIASSTGEKAKGEKSFKKE